MFLAQLVRQGAGSPNSPASLGALYGFPNIPLHFAAQYNCVKPLAAISPGPKLLQ